MRHPSAKFLLSGLLVMALVGVAVFFFFLQQDMLYDTPGTQDGLDAIPASATGDVSIIIKDEGFSPRGVHVRRGSRVTWINETSEDHWPASSIHPTHEIYPEFDPKRPLAPGERWSFVFERPGLWFYHDHTKPRDLGTIKVSD